MSTDDFVKKRYESCDFNEYVELWMRIFDQHSNLLLGIIDYEQFEYLYKIEKKYVVYKLNRMKSLPLDLQIILFSHLLSKSINLDAKEIRVEINEAFNKTKTLIF